VDGSRHAARKKCVIATSGYSYRDWHGPFYPESVKAKKELPYYAEHFPAVEINATFYRQPQPEHLCSLVSQTPDGFMFAVKGYKGLTHDGSRERDLAPFRRGLAPLLRSERLLAVLLQFPYRFHYIRKNREYVARLCDDLNDIPIALEFRHEEWYREPVITECRNRGISLVAVDSPDLPRLPPREIIPTSKLLYLRFHGRNRDRWWNGNNTSRYDYLYNEQELADWSRRLTHKMVQAERAAVFFNNHWRGQAVANARLFQSLMDAE